MKIKPWLWLSPGFSQSMGTLFLQTYGNFKDYQTITWKPFNWRGLEFTNPIGTAGGIDKNGDLIKHFWTLGVGFVEVGTITPKRQSKNSGAVLDRNIEEQSIWNKMGFPNSGLKSAIKKIKNIKQPHFTPIFVNIGKNRETPNDKAHEDYIKLIQDLHEYADLFVINISSPNTTDLRKLLEPESLQSFLAPVVQSCTAKNTTGHSVPLLLKISPDIDDSTLCSILDVSSSLNIDGWVLTNTTVQRSKDSHYPAEGGISGKPLSEMSKKMLSKTIEHLGPAKKDKLIVSVGGVLSPEDVFERLDMGADLVQTYSGVVFNGPFFFREIADVARRKYY